MPPQITAASPSRPPRSKRDSSIIARSVGKALADVMNKDKGLCSGDPPDSGAIPSSASRRVVATTREGVRGSRPSLDLTRGSSDKPTPKLVKRPPTAPSSFPSKPTIRTDNSSPVLDDSPSKSTGKASKPRTSLTLRGLSSALQPKPSHPPSALPKYKPKAAADVKLTIPRSGAKKRLSDWDGEKDEKPKDSVKGTEEDVDDDFVTVERPISPLPRRAARQPVLPVSLSLTPSTPPKKGNVLHKASSSMSSTPLRPSKVSKGSSASIIPISRFQSSQLSTSRPSSSASAHSLHETPVNSPSRNATPVSKAKTMSPMRPVRRQPTLTDSAIPSSSSSKLDASPVTPFQLPETSGSSLLSPPLSPFLEGVSVDSIDAGDVSALLSTIVSPTKPSSIHDPPPQTPLRTQHPLLDDSTLLQPQTPISQSSLCASSVLTTDPRQSILSLRKLLENSDDPEHLLTQPLPAILTSDARERLLSFGFSPGFVPPPFPSAPHRHEPQTPSPVTDSQSFMSISQVLFPQVGGVAPKTSKGGQEDPTLVELLKMQLASAEAQRVERDTRIGQLEGQLLRAREAREQEAAELSTQVSDLEEQLRALLVDREREKEADRRTEDLEARLRDKDAEWERQVAVSVAQAQERSIADQARLLDAERRKWYTYNVTEAWECVRTTASSELELVRSNKNFVEVTLAGLDVSMQQLRQSLTR